jgi:hypothetical protein
MFCRPRTGLGLAAALAAGLVLGGCGGVEFQGKLFDYAGLSGDGSTKEIKMSERAPLVLPPNTNVLPVPGQPAYTARQDWPTDTDAQQKKNFADQEAQQRQKAAELEPNNPYAGKPTLLDKVFSRKKTDENELVDVPEPDPTDKTPEDKAREQRELVANGGAKPVPPQIIEPTPPKEDDPFHPSAPDSYRQMQSGAAGN